MARPTDYTEELLQVAEAYANNGWREAGDAVPTIAGLAMAIGVRRETCYAWESDPAKSAFSNICENVRAQQERELVNNGLRGDFAAPIAKMMMTKHGYSDRQELDHTSAGNEIKTFAAMYAHQPKNEDGES